MSTFYTILTDRGKSKLSTCIAQGTSLPLSKLAVGEGLNNSIYPLEANQTALKSEKHRGDINAIYRDVTNPKWIVAELVIPVDQGGFYTREAGVYDTDGELFAVGLLPESYKPAVSSGAAKTQTIRLVIEVGSDAQVTLAVDNSMAFITQAGLAAQLDLVKAQFIAKSDFVYSFATNGYALLPGGLIYQWGQGYANTQGYCDVTFPIALTTILLDRQALPHQTTADNIQRSMTWATDVYQGSLTMTRYLMRKEGSKKTDGYFSWNITGK
jgi:Phage-related tail fibre protein